MKLDKVSRIVQAVAPGLTRRIGQQRHNRKRRVLVTATGVVKPAGNEVPMFARDRQPAPN